MLIHRFKKKVYRTKLPDGKVFINNEYRLAVNDYEIEVGGTRMKWGYWISLRGQDETVSHGTGYRSAESAAKAAIDFLRERLEAMLKELNV